MNASSPIPSTMYFLRQRSCDLEGLLVGEQMLVAAGSSVRADPSPGSSETILSRRSRLESEAVAEIIGERFAFDQDYVFADHGRAVDLTKDGYVRHPLKLCFDANGTSLHDHENSE